jgi:hypothetical protein
MLAAFTCNGCVYAQVLYRLAESQFLRMLAKSGGGASSITQIEYRVDPKLERAFASKQREYDKQCEARFNQQNCMWKHQVENFAFDMACCIIQTGKTSTSAASFSTGPSLLPTSIAS